MDPRILRRALWAYTVYVALFIVCAVAKAFHVDVSPFDPFFHKTPLLVYLVVALIFLRDLIFRRSLSPDVQYRWVAGFLLFHIFAFWFYECKVVRTRHQSNEV